MELLSSYLLPIMMTIAWLAAISVATKNLVYDRENGQEEVSSVICNEKWFDVEQSFILEFNVFHVGIPFYGVTP